MYGTVMISRSNAPIERIREVVAEWRASIGDAAGFVDERVLVGDNGQVVACVRFRERAAYEALADLPAQDVWWQETMQPLLEGEVSWIDGNWHDL
jgi:hypothetical protein